MKVYYLAGLISCILAVGFLILDINTYVYYIKWLSISRSYIGAFEPSPNLLRIYTLFSIDFSSMGVTFLIIHFKKWNQGPKITDNVT